MPEKQIFEIPRNCARSQKRISSKRGRLTVSSWMP